MNSIIASAELSILGAKAVALFFILIGGSYFLLNHEMLTSFVPTWKKVFILGLMAGLINAGIYIAFFRYVQPLAPLVIITIILLWLFDKMPLWNWKYIVGFVSLFITVSGTFFFLVLGVAFHLAVEGKI